MEPPEEPIIPRKECYAALMLILHLCENICESGDVDEDVLKFVMQVRNKLQPLDYRKFVVHKEWDAHRYIVSTGFLPACRTTSRTLAGRALLRLMEAKLATYEPDHGCDYVGDKEVGDKEAKSKPKSPQRKRAARKQDLVA